MNSKPVAFSISIYCSELTLITDPQIILEDNDPSNTWKAGYKTCYWTNRFRQHAGSRARYATQDTSEQTSPFEIMFGRKPRTSLDTLVPQIDDLETSAGPDSFVEQRCQFLRVDDTKRRSQPEKGQPLQNITTFNRSNH